MEIAGLVKNSFVDYPAHIAATIFTCGCNMNCWYCHNREIINQNKGGYDESAILSFLEERVGFLEGVVITGGEPTLQPDLKEFIEKIKKLNYKVKLDTNGSKPQVIADLIKSNLLDYIAMDIKAPFEKYNIVTLCDDISKIQQSVGIIMNSKVPYEFRTTFAPNLTVDDIKTIMQEIKGANTYSLQLYVKPSYIVDEILPNHTKQEFEQLKKCSKGFIKNFNIKNI